MRRSSTILAPMLTSTAVTLLAGCAVQMQRCVDSGDRVVAPAYCSNSSQPEYHYYYGGSGSYQLGTLAVAGTRIPEPNQRYSLTNGTTRDGFGTFFSDYAEEILFVAALGIIIFTTGSFTS